MVEKNGYQLALLEKYTDVNDLYKAVEDADALIVRSDKVTKEVIDHAKNLKIVVRAGAGYDNIDLEAATAHKVVAMNTPGQKRFMSDSSYEGRRSPRRWSLYNRCMSSQKG